MPSKFSFVYRLSFIVIFLSSLAFAEAPRVLPAILDSIPHEPTHFTQGLFFDGKDLIETTGQYGESGLYRRTLDGKILDSARLAPRYFGEGSIAVGEDIFYLTWKAKKAFIYSRKPFKYKGEFRIPTEGWGLTYWQNALLMSNGSDELLQIALGGFYVMGSIRVTDAGKPVKNLNELEIVGNTLYANIWQTALIAVIDLPSGKVQKYIDFSAKGREIYRNNPNIDVLNGIAYDGKYLWVT
ncbi:MAG: glutaminyl-peptide cyclotransferase, partial [Fibrobacter sp.]|nr:glutaminyl-peptide cyclotransferase [Fibrobacter sp.]